MLVLSRKEHESIRIGDNITIQIGGISKQRVKLQISAPLSLPVHRSEVYERICAKKASSGEGRA